MVPPLCESSNLSKEEWLLENFNTARSTATTRQYATPEYPWHRSPSQLDELAQGGGQTVVPPPAMQPPAFVTAQSASAAATPQYDPHVAGTVTAMSMAAQSANPKELREHVRSEMARVTAYMESLAATMQSVEAAHATATATPVPPDDDEQRR